MENAPASGPAGNGAPHRLALRATLHCLAGCSIGEVLGLVLGTTFGWSNLTTILAAVALAFAFGYTLTLIPLRQAGFAWKTVLGLALASDTNRWLIVRGRGHAVVHAYHAQDHHHH